ncbi:MAG: gliding motility-associated C-terminal domain-containing protein [Bacteroidota bacterium]
MFNTTYIKRLIGSIFMLLVFSNLNGFAQGPAVFTCDAAALYQTIRIQQNIPGVGSANDFIFYAVDPSTGEFQFVANLSVDDDGAANGDIALPGNINSIGFNPVDGFIYGINTDSSELYKISPNGFVQSLGNITGPLVNSGGKQAGVFDDNGIYYITGGSRNLYSIDLSSNPQPGDSFVSTFLFDIGKTTSDIAINPLTNTMYGWDQANNRRQLFTIDLDNGDVNVVGPAAGTSDYRVFGALYFTAGGQLIGYGDNTTVGPSQNSQETLVQIDLNTGVPNFIATSESVGINDGASCPYGLELFKDAPSNVDLGETFTYTFTIFNASGVPLTNLNFIDNLMDGLIFVSDPYNVQGGLEIVGNTNGLTNANLTINNVAIGVSTFQIDVTTDCSVENMIISNQATLSSDVITVVSDDPDAAGITNTTVTGIIDPSINVPDPLVLEGCDLSVITPDNSVFPLSFTESDDIKDVFNTVPDYTTTAPQNIESITYIDTIIDEESCVKVVNRAFSLTNTCGSTSVTVQVINVQDSTGPTFTVPADITIDCSEDPSNLSLVGNVSDFADNCSTNISASFVDTISNDGLPDTCSSAYTITRTWNVVDECNNVTSLDQIIVVEDNEAPTITNCSLTDMTMECAGVAGNENLAENWNAANISALEICAADNCNTEFSGLITSDFNFDNFVSTCGASGSISVIYTVTDGCGNGTPLPPVTLTFEDTVAPNLDTCPVENTILTCSTTDNEANADAWNAANIAALEGCAADGCDGDFTGQVTSNYDFNNLNTTCGPCGTLNVTYTVTDDCGNASNVNATLTFDDGTLPDLSQCEVIDQLFECSDTEDFSVIAENWNTSNISALENCTESFNVTVSSDFDFNNFVLACGETGSLDVLYTVTDNCGNVTTFDAVFVIEDTTSPVFDGIDDDECIAEFINGSAEANTFDGTFIQFQQEEVPGWQTTASHNTIEIQRSGQIDGSIPFDGNYHLELNCQGLDDLYQEFCTIPGSTLDIIFYHKKRAGGNNADVLELFAGSDLNNLTSLGLFEVFGNEGWKQNIVNYSVPAGQDSTIVLFQAISGNTSSIGNLLDAVSVISSDNSFGPLPTDITVECNEIPDAPSLTASDGCGEATVAFTETINEGTCDNEYVIIRNWVASDECGNTVEHTQNITVVDTTEPGFSQNLPGDITVECDEVPEAPTVTADDNCGPATVIFTENSTFGDCPFDEVIERTWVATDECGNTNTHTQIITVQDTTPPDAPDAPEDYTVEDVDPADIAPVTLTAIDNCSGEIDAVSVDTVDDSDPNNIVITRTWTFTDDCGNTTTISQTITIIQDLGFVCDGQVFYQTIRLTQNIAGVGSNGDFIMYLVDPQGNFSFFANLSVDDDGAGDEDVALVDTINGIGFNTEDGLVYGIDSGNDTLYRILPNGFMQNLGVISGPIGNTSNFSGAFDNDGNYYILGQNGNLVLVDGVEDLEPGEGTTSTLLAQTDVRASDIAISPSDFLVYLWDQQDNQLKTIDPETGAVNVIGPAANTSNFGIMGALYFTASGQLFGYGDDTNVGGSNNSQETFMQFDLETGVPTPFSTGLSIGTNDGASCAFGFELLKDAPDEVDLGQEFTYTFTIANSTGEPLNDLQFIDDLIPGLVFVSDPYNATNGMTITGLTNGLTSANLTISNVIPGQSTFQIYVVTDCSVETMTISNQATLSSEFLTVTSDDPDQAGVTNTTVTGIVDPSISLPNPLEIEGCDISALTAETAVFPLSETTSGDVKDIFNTVPDYTTTAPQNIESITYIDVIVDENVCPIVVNRTFTLTNICGIETELVQEISIVDTIAPTFTVPDDIMIECDDDPTFLSLTGDVTDEDDNCSSNLEATFTDSIEEGVCAGEMVITRTWTVTDDCGNSTSQVQIVTMQDSVAPTFTVPADVTIDCAEDVNNLELTGNVSNVADNCQVDLDITFTDSVNSGECPVTSIVTRVWTVSDGCNETSLEQIINIEDTTAPVVVGDFTDIIDVTCDDIPEVPNLEFTDNCAQEVSVDFTETINGNQDDVEYSITRTWTVNDGCNEAEFVQTINVINDLVISTNEDELCIGEDFGYDLFNLIDGNLDEEGTWTAENANIVLDGNLFNPSQLLNEDGSANEEDLGEINFTYSYEGQCAGEVTATLILNADCVVLACGRENLEISRAVTPNGDTVNDTFEIGGVDGCGFTFEVQIFNRWGAKIYENMNYQNDWGGETSDGSIGSSGLVPTGTYYYVVKINNSGFEPIAGPIYVSTN